MYFCAFVIYYLILGTISPAKVTKITLLEMTELIIKVVHLVFFTLIPCTYTSWPPDGMAWNYYYYF